MIATRPRARWCNVMVAVALSVLALPTNPAGATSSLLLKLAHYAVNTASHASPAHAVTDADVLNAFDTPSLNPSLNVGAPGLAANLGDLPGAPRDILSFNPTTFRQTCVYFAAKIGASPTVVTCPKLAIALWTAEPLVLDVSRDAVAAAAQKGAPVSGADVVTIARANKLRLATPPTFASGDGGVVTFVVRSTTSSGVISGDLCVLMPSQRYGIPRIERCRGSD